MRDWSQRARLAIAILVGHLAITTQAIAGSDMVVMPFRCDVVDGKPVLTPSREEEGHPILGSRETKKVQTCSTVDSKRCRQWTTFKFDMDCGGTRVAWMQVFANASEHTRRKVWERNGRLRVRDTAMRNPRIDDMCARRLGPQLEWTSTSQLCDEVSTLTAPTATDMPAGFAPMIGLDAAILSTDTFAKIAARYGRTEPAVTKAAATAPAPEPKRAMAPEPNQDARAPAPAKAEPPAAAVAKPESPAPAATVVQHDRHQLVPAHAETSKPDEIEMAAADQPPAAEPTLASTSHAPSTPSETEPLPVRAAEAGAPVIINSAATNEAAAEPPAAPKAVQKIEPDDAPPPEVPVIEADQDIAYLAIALASGLLMITLLVIHWLGNAKAAAGDASRSTSDAEQVTSQPAATAFVPPSETPVASPHISSPSANAIILTRPRRNETKSLDSQALLASHRPVIGDRMPNSKHEALQVLGMGVASENNVTSLKKIIDGLRMNWHPDHASNEIDRQTRELRLKQINAAWEILGGKGAEA